MEGLEFRQVETAEQRRRAGALIREYLEFLNARLRDDHGIAFDVEAMLRSDLADRHKFHPPHGRFTLVESGGLDAGVGCLKRLRDDVAEIQRMYVPVAFRGRSVGRALTERLIADARSIGYRQLKLESLEFLAAAHALYRSLGFREIDAYARSGMKSYQPAEQLERYNAVTVFMEMDLDR